MERMKPESEKTDIGVYIDELGRMLADLKSVEVGLSAPQIIPGEAVYRDQRDVFHQITLGAAMSPTELVGDTAIALHWKDACARCNTLGEALAIFLCKAGPRLEDLGRYAEWRRRYDNYMVRQTAVARPLYLRMPWPSLS